MGAICRRFPRFFVRKGFLYLLRRLRRIDFLRIVLRLWHAWACLILTSCRGVEIFTLFFASDYLDLIRRGLLNHDEGIPLRRSEIILPDCCLLLPRLFLALLGRVQVDDF